ncbi:MAG: hypothetical protein IKH57_05810 [Clostridia bacterium]|nr:hypothetical protein [Clostridia bacterium]
MADLMKTCGWDCPRMFDLEGPLPILQSDAGKNGLFSARTENDPENKAESVKEKSLTKQPKRV